MKDFIKSGRITNFDDIVYSKREYYEVNPWDFIEMPFNKSFLVKECNRLLNK